MLCPSFLRAGTRRSLHTHWPLLLGFPFLFLLYACDSDVGSALAPEDVLADIVLSASSLELSPGDTVRLEVTLINKNGKPMPSKVPLDWSTSNETVASVDQAGLVLAKNRGEAKITVGRGSIESSVPVTVQGGSEPEDPPGDDPGEDDPEPEDPPEDDPGEDDPQDEPEPEDPPEDDPGEDDPEDEPEPEDPPEDDPGEDDPEDEPEPEDPPSAPGIDRTMDGFHSGFTVPAGETWQVLNVETDRNIVVLGKLVMRPGASLTFVNVDESKFVGGGMDVIDSDVGLWVMGSGVLDIQGTPKQSWNRTGHHPTWLASDEYVRAPHAAPRRNDPKPWNLGDPVPCTRFAGKDYCAEVVNLTRDINIEGTPEGHAHIFIRSNKPQTIRFAALRWMSPMIDFSDPDGRYAIHFHHSGNGSRGSIVEGVVVRDADDHAFAPHESHGITFRQTVAYNVINTAYWWDPGDISNDIHYDYAMVLGLHQNPKGGRESPSGWLAGFRMARGTGNKVTNSVAAAVWGKAGWVWPEGSPNKWEFTNNTAHHAGVGVYHWRNESTAEEAHIQNGFVSYRNSKGVEQGAYGVQSIWTDVVMFDNSHEAIHQRAAPRNGGETSHFIPGIAFTRSVLGGGYIKRSDGIGNVIKIASRRNCERPGNHSEYADLWLLDFEGPPILVSQETCAHSTDRFNFVFKNVVVGPEKRDLEPSDFAILAMPADGIITVIRTNGTTFTIEQ